MGKFRWGIFGTGFVAGKFALGLKALDDHEIVAVASRSQEKAKAFAAGLKVDAICGSYAEIACLENVDAIYIATPPNVHKLQALMCIAAAKAVLVEKPFAMNAAEAAEIRAAAQANGVFCMEAMWTRFNPAVQQLKNRVDAGDLGEIRMLNGSFGIQEVPSESNHLFNKAMGGGAVLDRGVYLISLAVYLLGKPDYVSGVLIRAEGGVDEQAAITLGWQDKITAQFTISLIADLANNLSVSGSKARIELDTPIYRPSRLRIFTSQAISRSPAQAPSKKDHIRESGVLHLLHQYLLPLLKAGAGKKVNVLYSGNAYHYQAEEVRQCVQGGKLESALMPLSDSVAVMEIIDRLLAK